MSRWTGELLSVAVGLVLVVVPMFLVGSCEQSLVPLLDEAVAVANAPGAIE